ncbi:MAG TPA: UDP-N-acetylglucosamine 2-epimerase [Candidatus Limnocylindria bacterium]|nr:UDP-N-acetylglucosamine 2-epimerase [Candidatus Limnocylindria bacterium]
MEVVSVIAGHEHLNKAAAIDYGLPRDTLDIRHTMLDLKESWGQAAQTSISQLGLDRDDIQWIEPPHAQLLNHFSSSAAEYVGKRLDELAPDLLLLYGDLPGSSSSALGTWMSKGRFPFVHIESGLRTGNMRDVEEVGRLGLDMSAHAHTTHLAEAYAQLRSDSYVASNNVFLGINPITAILDLHMSHRQMPDIAGLNMNRPYIVSTIHREETLLNNEHFFAKHVSRADRTTGNFPEIGDGDQEALPNILNALEAISKDVQVVFIQYGSSKEALTRLGWEPPNKNIVCTNTLPFHEYLGTLWDSRGVITDSSGLLVEAAHLGKPALVLRKGTHHRDALTPKARIGGVGYSDIMDAYQNLQPYFTKEQSTSFEANVEHVEAELKRLGRFLIETANGRDIGWFGRMAIKHEQIFHLRHVTR